MASGGLPNWQCSLCDGNCTSGALNRSFDPYWELSESQSCGRRKSISSASEEDSSGVQPLCQRTKGGKDIKMASVLPPL